MLFEFYNTAKEPPVWQESYSIESVEEALRYNAIIGWDFYREVKE